MALSTDRLHFEILDLRQQANASFQPAENLKTCPGDLPSFQK
jgi:hypothetical protein